MTIIKWQTRMLAGAAMSLMMAATATGQFQRISGTAQSNMVPCAGPGHLCYPQSIAVGPNANGSTNGTAWVLGTAKTSAGDYYVYRRQGSTWVPASIGAGTQIAVGIDGYPWVITHTGAIYYWNGTTFLLAPGNGCATAIGVGPNQFGSTYGDPWIIGCNGSSTTDGSIYQLAFGNWVQQPGAANRIAVLASGVPWAVTASGSMWVWTGFGWASGAPGSCASSIAAGQGNAEPNADVWIIACTNINNQGAYIYQLQSDGIWLQIPGVASQVALSPDYDIPWVVTLTGEIFAAP